MKRNCSEELDAVGTLCAWVSGLRVSFPSAWGGARSGAVPGVLGLWQVYLLPLGIKTNGVDTAGEWFPCRLCCL